MFNKPVLHGCDISHAERKMGLWVRGVPYVVPDAIIEVLHISADWYCVYVGRQVGMCFGNNYEFTVYINANTIGELFEGIDDTIGLLCDLIHPNNKW